MILIAKCRLGYCCRYHGRTVYSPALMKKLKGLKYQGICPEISAGYAIPREPIKIKNNKYYMGDKDITENIINICEKLTLKNSNVKYFIGVNGSPCCDPTAGLFPKALKKLGIKTKINL